LPRSLFPSEVHRHDVRAILLLDARPVIFGLFVRFRAGFGIDMELQREIDGRVDKGGDGGERDVQVRRNLAE